MPVAPSNTTTKIDVSDSGVSAHWRTAEEMAADLDAWLEEAPDDVIGIARALGDIAHAKEMALAANDADLCRKRLYRALSEGTRSGFDRMRQPSPRHVDGPISRRNKRPGAEKRDLTASAP
jgi:probable addiction module antidote protein